MRKLIYKLLLLMNITIFATPKDSLYFNTLKQSYLKEGKTALENIIKNNPKLFSEIDFTGIAKLKANESKIEDLHLLVTIAEISHDNSKIALSSFLLGEKYYNANISYDSGLVYFKKAHKNYEIIKDNKGIAKSLLYVGLSYKILGDNDQALIFYKQANSLFHELNDSINIARVLCAKADVFYYLGKSQESLQILDTAFTIFKQQKAEDMLADLYKIQGKVYYITREYLKALEVNEKALAIYEQKKDTAYIAGMYKNIADIYLRNLQYEKAEQLYQKALKMSMKVNDNLAIGNILKALGKVYYYSQDTISALKMYKTAIPFYEKSKDIIGLANTFVRRGEIYTKNKDYVNAIKTYDKALPYYQKAKHALGLGNVQFCKADAYFALKDYKQAIKYSTNALYYYSYSNDIESSAEVYQLLAHSYSMLNQPDTAKYYYEKCITFLERVRSQIGVSELKTSYMGAYKNTYNNVFSLLFDSGNFDKAFYYSEAMKARVFLDILSESKLVKGVDSISILQIRKLENNIIKIKEQQLKKFKQSFINTKSVDSLADKIEEIYNNIDDIKIKARLKNPLYASIKYPQPVNYKEIQENGLKDNETLIDYTILDKTLYAFLISKSQFVAKKIFTDTIDIATKINEFIALINTKNNTEIKQYQRLFYNILINPIIDNIKTKKILIVPDGYLTFLPFETLMSEKQKLLIEKYNVRYIQSATIQNLIRNSGNLQNTNCTFVGFGDPIFNYNDFINGKENTTGSKIFQSICNSSNTTLHDALPRLKETGKEIVEISKIFKKFNYSTKTYLREDATEKNIRDQKINNYAYIHLATHGLVNSKMQYLALTRLPGDNNEDGILTADELMNCHFNAKLVVLSACNTGLGSLENGEGITGLTRAAMYAGTPAVMVSLWSVDDFATKDFMLDFYKAHIGEKLALDEALRQAKLKMLKSKKYANPYYWAPFIIYGE